MELKLEAFDDIVTKGYFIEEGCGCADFVYQVESNLWLVIDRSCRSSGSTSDDRLWELHQYRFLRNIKFQYHHLNGNKDIDYIEDYGVRNDSITLEKELEKQLYEFLKQRTNDKWGSEYR